MFSMRCGGICGKKLIGAYNPMSDEIDAAVYYAAVGIEDVKPEKTELAKEREKNETPDERERKNFAALEEKLAEAAAATGLTFDDIMLQTPSRLRGMIYAAHVQAGMEMTKQSAKAHADYLATLNAITNRLRAENQCAKADKMKAEHTMNKARSTKPNATSGSVRVLSAFSGALFFMAQIIPSNGGR